MGKISDSRVELLRPDYSDANALLVGGLKSLQEAPKPFMDAMKANFDYRKDEATGILNQYITQNDPNQPGFQEGLQSLMGQVNFLGNGVSQSDLSKTITSRQEAVPLNEQRLLANLATKEGNDFNNALNNYLMGDKSPEAMQALLARGENSTHNFGGGMQDYAVKNAAIDAARTGNGVEVAKLLASLGIGAETTTAALQQGNAFLKDEVSSIDTSPGGGSSGGKQSSYQSTPSNGSNSGSVGSGISFGAAIDKDLSDTVNRYGVDGNFLRGLLSMEDGTTGKKSSTGALGVGQFVQGTWNNLANTPEGKAIGMTRINSGNFQKGNDPRRNNRVNMLATGLLAKQNQATLERNGVPVNAQTLYMAHNMGPATVLAAYGKGKTTKKMQQDMVRNGGRGDMSAADFVNFQTKKFNQHYKKANGVSAGTGGSVSTGGGGYVPRQGNYAYGDSEVIPNQMKLNSAYNEDTMSRVLGLIQGIKADEVGNFGIPKLGAPGEGSALNASLTGLIGDKYKSDVGLIRDSTDNLIEGSKKKTENVIANQAENKQLELERLAAEYAEAEGGVVNLSDVLDDVPAFEKALKVAGISKEMFGQLPTNQQVSYLEPFQKWEADNKAHYAESNAYKIPGGLSTAKSDKINKKKNKPEPSPVAVSLAKSMAVMNNVTDTKTGKEFREEGWFRKAGWLGTNVESKRKNYTKFNEDLVRGVAEKLLGSEENRKVYDGLFTEGDIQSLTLKIQKEYFKYANNNHTNRSDIGGVGNKVVNPRKLEEITNSQIKIFTKAANAKLKLNQTKGTPKNPAPTFDYITLKNIHGEK